MTLIKVLVVSAYPFDQPLVDLFSKFPFQMEQAKILPENLQQPEILVMDAAELPIHLLSQLRQMLPSAIIVILSSRKDLELKIDYLNVGADVYFERPVNSLVVLAHVQALMRRKNIK